MKKLLFILAVAGYMSACAPATNTTSSTGTTNDEASSDTNTSDDAASDTETSGTGTTDSTSNSGSSSTTNSDMSTSTATDSTSTNSDMESTESDMESADDATSPSSSDMSAAESDIMGTSTTITMEQLPKAVRDAYTKMPGHANATGVKVYQVKTSQHPVMYKIEGTSGSTDYVHYFTPDGNEVKMSGTNK